MSAPPYMKLYWGDYHKSTRHLTRDHHGAYFLLIGEAWRLGGALPDDDRLLAAWALCSPSEWSDIKGIVMAFFTLRRGRWLHDRVREELASYETISRKRKEAGRKGGLISVEKDNGKPEAIAYQLPTKPEPEPEPYKKDDDVVSRTREGDWPEGDPAKALVAEISSPWLDPQKTAGLVLTAARISAWRREGASWRDDVLPVVASVCSRRNSPISSWQFFDAAIAQSIANNRAGLTIPDARAGPQTSITDRIAAERAEAFRLMEIRLDANG